MSTLPAAAAGSKDDFLPSEEGLFTSLAGLRLRRDSLVRDTGERERRSKRDVFFSGSVWSKRERFTRGASSAMIPGGAIPELQQQVCHTMLSEM